MNIYYDTISEALNLRPIRELVPDYEDKYDVSKEDFINCGWGGETTTNTIWITNGKIETLIMKNDKIPLGYKKGRCNSKFNDSESQKIFAEKRDLEKHSKKLKLAWSAGKYNKRDNSKLGITLHTEETKRIISEKAKQRNKLTCPYCGKICQPAMAKRWHFENCKEKKIE